MKHIFLRQVLEWRVEIDHGWSVPVGFLGKGLKKRLPADLWSAVEGTYAGACVTDNWEALAQTLDVFRHVAVEVAEYFGYTYPDELHQRIWAYVEKIRQLEPSEVRYKL